MKLCSCADSGVKDDKESDGVKVTTLMMNWPVCVRLNVKRLIKSKEFRG